MRFIIDISDAHVRKLRFWASVSRTLTTSAKLVEMLNLDERALGHLSPEQRSVIETVADDAIANIVELNQITVAIDSLHKAFQEACNVGILKVLDKGLGAIPTYVGWQREAFIGMLAPEERAAFKAREEKDFELRKKYES